MSKNFSKEMTNMIAFSEGEESKYQKTFFPKGKKKYQRAFSEGRKSLVIIRGI